LQREILCVKDPANFFSFIQKLKKIRMDQTTTSGILSYYT
jgi:hypothetical protein